MAVHRYAVLDVDGVKINTITADDALISTDWYPGYGALLVEEGELLPEPPPPLPPRKPGTWRVYPQLPEPMVNGDRLDPATGVVTKKQPDAPVDVVVVP